MPQTGQFVWFDRFTTDKQAAIEFYTAVTGWTITTWDGPQAYSMWTAANGHPIGGVEESEAVAPMWAGYVEVEDVDASCARAEELGGTVLDSPVDMEGVGRVAMIADPSGASLFLIKPESPEEGRADEGDETGTITWCELATTAPEKAVRFWFKLLGWTDVNTMKMPQGKYMIFGPNREHRGYGGMYKAADGDDSHWLYYITVADLDAACARVAEHGGAVTSGPMEVPGDERVALCTDHEGVAFALHSF